MQAIQVTNVATKICDPGNRDFIHILNNSDVTIYFSYDGDAATVTTALGIPIGPGQPLTLENTGPRQLFTKAVYAIHGAGAVNKEVRVQGV